MQLQYLLVVIDVSDISDVKVMSSAVAVIFAITRVVNNYNIRTDTNWFHFNRTQQNAFQTESDFFPETELQTN